MQAALEQTIEHLNEVFVLHLPNERFMSAILSNINHEGELRAIIAGHPPLIIIPANGGDPIALRGKAPMLGIVSKPLFKVQEVKYDLMPGDKGILYTDGIYERANSEGEMFGIDKLKNFLKENRTQDMDSLLSQLLEHVDAFTQGETAHDDITLVAFEYINSGASLQS